MKYIWKQPNIYEFGNNQIPLIILKLKYVIILQLLL